MVERKSGIQFKNNEPSTGKKGFSKKNERIVAISSAEEADVVKAKINSKLLSENVRGDILKSDFLNRTSFNLKEQMNEIIRLLQDKWSEKNVFLDYSGEDVSVIADRELLKAAWISLLDNSILMSPEDDTVKVSVTREADQAVIEVTNYGKPMDGRMVCRAFRIFEKGDRLREDICPSFALVQNIVDLHEGIIMVQSDARNGTIITALIPADENEYGTPVLGRVMIQSFGKEDAEILEKNNDQRI